VAGTELRLYSLIIFLCPCALFLSLSCARSTTTTRASGSLETSLPPCQIGRDPTCLATSCTTLSRLGSSLHSPSSWSGGCPGKGLCRACPAGTWSRSWPSTSAASPSPSSGSSGGPLRVRPPATTPQPEQHTTDGGVRGNVRGVLLMVKFYQPSHEFTFGVGMTFIPYPLVLTPLV
jgi:hypothetical protein